MDPHVRHTRYSPGKAQEILPGAAVLVCYEEAVIGCAALDQEGGGRGCHIDASPSKAATATNGGRLKRFAGIPESRGAGTLSCTIYLHLE